MIFHSTSLKGAYLIEPIMVVDHRGFFARVRCEREFAAHGLNCRWVQSSISLSKRKGTLRGMHFQAPPHSEIKLVRCVRGSIFDAIIDLRPQSPTYLQHFTAILSAENRAMLYISEGMAHGFQTLEDETEVLYEMSEFYDSRSARGVRWNDPVFQVPWPDADRIMLERDRTYPDFVPDVELSNRDRH